MEIEFQGQFDKVTIYKAVKLANKPSKRNSIIRIGLTILFLAIYIAYFISVGNQENLSTFDFLRAGRHLFTLPFIAFFLLQPYISSYFTASNLWKNPSMQKPLSGAISNQGIAYISSSKTRHEIVWDRFAKKQSSENLIVLLTADGILSIFPRQFFKTADDWQRIKQLIDFKVTEAV